MKENRKSVYQNKKKGFLILKTTPGPVMVITIGSTFKEMSHLHIKNLFALKWGLNKEVSLRKALKILNKELVGQHHNALDDALNTTEILKACL